MAVKKLPNGRWEASYRDPAGKEHIKRHRTRAEADRWLATVKTDIQRGEYVEPRLARSSFKEWSDLWLSTTVHLKLKTQVDYEAALRNHVLPAFENRSVASIQQVDVRRFIADMTDAGAGPGTVGAARKVLRLVLNTAVGSGAIRANPCDGVRVPHSPKEAMLFLTAEEVERLASTITPPYGTLVRFAAYTGLRAGEIGALRVGRVDLLKGRVRIEESVSEVQGHGLVYGEPKTYQRRSVPLLASIRDEIGELLAGRDLTPDSLVFRAPQGGPLRHKNFYRRFFKPAVAAAELPAGLRFHDLRHTCAALLIALGAHPKAIQERLGHSTINITLDRYGHLFPALDEALTDRLEEMRTKARAEVERAPITVGAVVPITTR
jgi:integrase